MNLTPEIKLELERRARQTKDKHEHTRLCVILARSWRVRNPPKQSQRNDSIFLP